MACEESEDDTLSHLRNVEKLAFKIIGQQTCGEAIGSSVRDSWEIQQDLENGDVPGKVEPETPGTKTMSVKAGVAGPPSVLDVSSVAKSGSTETVRSQDGILDQLASASDPQCDDGIGLALSCLDALATSQGPPEPTNQQPLVSESGTAKASPSSLGTGPTKECKNSKKVMDDQVVSQKLLGSSPDASKSSAVTDESGNLREVSCEKCSVQLSSKEDLAKHDCSNPEGTPQDKSQMITVNLVDKGKLECTECSFRAAGSAFEEHLMCHLLERPYQCLYCATAFRNRGEISRHVLMEHHGKKMNCALKAMKMAKSLIERAMSGGTHTFKVQVKGKVPVYPARKRHSSDVQKQSSSGAKPKLGELSGSPAKTPKTGSSPEKSGETKVKNVAKSPEKSGDGLKSSSVAILEKVTSTKTDTGTAEDLNSVEKSETMSKINDNSGEISSDVGKDNLKLSANEKPLDTPGGTRDERVAKVVENIPDAKVQANGPTDHGDQKESDKPAVPDELRVVVEDQDKSEIAGAGDHETNAGVTTSFTKQDVESENLSPATELAETVVESSSAPAETDAAVSDDGLTEAMTTEGKDGVADAATEEDAETGNVLDADSSKRVDTTTTAGTCGDVEEDSVTVPRSDSIVNMEEQPSAVVCEGMETDDISKEPGMESSMETDNSQVAATQEAVDAAPDAAPDAEAGAEADAEAGEDLEDTVCPKDESITQEQGQTDPTECPSAMDLEPATAKASATEEETPREPGSMEAALVMEKSPEPADSNDAPEFGLKIVAAFSLQPDGNDPSGVGKGADAIYGHHESEDVDSRKEDSGTGEKATEHGASDGDNVPNPVLSEPVADRTSSSPSVNQAHSQLQGSVDSSLFADSNIAGAFPPGRVVAPVPAHENFYVCGFEQCSFSSSLSGDFREHMLLKHFHEKMYRCYHCGSITTCEDGLLRHMSNHAITNAKKVPLYFCGAENCRFGTNLTHDLVSHWEICHPDSVVTKCHECEDYFANVQDLVKHFESHLLNVVSCPHCSAKGSLRRAILKHIALYHPGKPKMVSVGKQILCRERKLNSYIPQMKPSVSSPASHTVQFSSPSFGVGESRGSLVADSREGSPLSAILAGQATESGILPDVVVTSAHIVNVKKEKVDPGYDAALGPRDSHQSVGKDQLSSLHSQTARYQDSLCCQQCTFVGKDLKQMVNHSQYHTIPSSKKQRFVCMYCPQGFSEFESFKNHVQCHPGSIQYHHYGCKQCSFDTNQRFVILNHIRKKNPSHEFVDNEGDMFAVVEQTLPSLVLQCDHCDYKTRSQISLDVHNKREHHMDSEGMAALTNSQDTRISQMAPQDIERQKLLALAHTKTMSMDVNTETPLNRFKCPLCRELFPKQSGLKEHIRLHQDADTITLIMYTCKYCTTSSTSKEIISFHLKERHPTRDSCLIKKLLSLDIKSMGLPKDRSGQAPPPTQTSQASPPKDETLTWVIILCNGTEEEDSSECSVCHYKSHSFDDLREHSQTAHPEVVLMGRQGKGGQLHQISENFVNISQDLEGTPGLKNEAVIVPDKQVFTVSAPCPKCKLYVSYFRRNIILHIQKQHPEMMIIPQNAVRSIVPAPPGQPPQMPAEPPLRKLSPAKPVAEKKSSPSSQGDLCMIGSASLDEKIKCLYSVKDHRYCCSICSLERPKKYFMHVHLLQHLDIQLCKCIYCDYSGLQKYKIVTHVKKSHPNLPVKVKYIKVDLTKRIQEFLSHGHVSPHVKPQMIIPSPSFSAVPHLPEENQVVEVTAKPESPGKTLSCSLGSDKLDASLSCLYEMTENDRGRCLLCAADFQRRFAIHRHLLTHHLKVSLLKCHYCQYKGVEKNQIIDHILAKHKNQPIWADKLKVNFEEKVTALLDRHGTLSKFSLTSSSGRKLEKRSPSTLLSLLSGTSPGVSKPKAARGPGFASPSEDAASQPMHLGKESLHAVLVPLLKELNKGALKCRICSLQFPKRYSMHRHLLMKHLKLPLLGCSLCAFTGFERYQISSHISETHSGRGAHMIDRDIDIAAKVTQYVQELGRLQQEMRNPDPTEEESKEEHDVKPDLNKLNASMDESNAGGNDSHLVVSKFWQKRKAESPSSSSSPASSPGYRSSHFPATGRHKKLRLDVTTNIRVVSTGGSGEPLRHFCEKCGFDSVHRSNVHRHILRVHERYTEKECSLCGYKTLSSLLLADHMREIHSDNAERGEATAAASEEVEESQDTSRMAMFACAYCNFETDDANKISQHTTEKHDDEMDGNKTPGEPVHKRSPQKRAQEWEEEDGLDPKFPKLDWLGSRPTTKPSFANRDRDESHCCPYCLFTCPSKVALRIHMRKHRAKTSVIGKRKKNSSATQTHTKDGRPLRFRCGECGIKTRQQTKMRYHFNRHLKYRPYGCTTCGMMFPSPDQMRKHAKRVSHSSDYSYHKNEEIEDRVNEMIDEGRISVKKKKASRKKKKSTPVASTPLPPEPEGVDWDGDQSLPAEAEGEGEDDLEGEDSSLVQTFECTVCDAKRTSFQNLKRHHVKEHRKYKFIWRDSETGFVANMKGLVSKFTGPCWELTFKEAEMYQEEHDGDKRTFTCKRCEFRSPCLQAIKAHVKSHMIKPFLCTYCSLRYFHREIASTHQTKIHPGCRPWLIQFTEIPGGATKILSPSQRLQAEPLSPKDSPSQLPLLTPPEKVQGPLKYLCPQCRYSTIKFYHFRLHLASHGSFTCLCPDLSSDSTLKCGCCSYLAESSEDFSQHLNTHLNDRTVKCAYCDYSAFLPSSVRRHQKSYHPGQPEVVETIDTSAANVAMGRKDRKGELAMLVNMDPMVVLKDVRHMTREEMEALFSGLASSHEVMKVQHGDEDGNIDVEDCEVDSESEAGGPLQPAQSGSSQMEESTKVDSEAGLPLLKKSRDKRRMLAGPASRKKARAQGAKKMPQRVEETGSLEGSLEKSSTASQGAGQEKGKDLQDEVDGLVLVKCVPTKEHSLTVGAGENPESKVNSDEDSSGETRGNLFSKLSSWLEEGE